MNPDVVSVWVRVTENLTQLKSWDNVIVTGRRALFLLRHSKSTLLQGSPRSSSKKSPIRITSDTYYAALFTTLQCLGQAHTSLSNYPLAKDACSESLHLSWEMALSTHNGLTTAASSTTKNNEVLRVIRALKRLGKAHLLQGQYSPALECFLPSLELLRSSKETEMTMDCASVLGSLGFLYLKLKKFTESSNFLRQCLRLYRKNGEFLLYPLRIISLFQEQLIRPNRHHLCSHTQRISVHRLSLLIGVDTNDREFRKVNAWLEMAESREEESGMMPPSFLEIPTFVIHDENGNSLGG